MKSDAIRNVDGKIGEKRECEKVCEKKREGEMELIGSEKQQ